MAKVRIAVARTFVAWTCPCGHLFRYPDGRFPQAMVNDHWDTNGCVTDRHAAGMGQYHFGLSYSLVRPHVSLDADRDWEWDKRWIRV